VNPLTDLSSSIRGWSEIVAGKADAVRHFRLRGSGPVIAFAWLLVAILLSVAVQSAAIGVMPSGPQLLLGLFGQAVTVAVLGVATAQTLHFLKLDVPLNTLFIPMVYALAYMFVVSVPLTLLGQATGLLAIIAVGVLIFRGAVVLGGMRLGVSIAFAIVCVIVLVVVPNALYILFLQIPSP
jgi:hypothetical protein